MAKNTSSDSSDSSESESSASESSETSQVSPSRRSGRQKDDSQDEEPDPRDRFLLPSFQPKPIRSTVSDWARKTLRSPFLGQPMAKEERKGFMEEYFCSPNDFKEFSAPTIHDSPLSLLHHSNSDAQNDLTRVHNDLLFGVRIGLLYYERCINLCANWAPEDTNPVTFKVIPAGPWASFDYKYKDGHVPCPVPHKLRPNITQDQIDELLGRDFVVKANGPDEKLQAICRWAISYKMGYEQQQVFMDEIHVEALNFFEALKEIRTSTDIMRKDSGSALRLFGSVCQQIKSIREAKYTESLDGAFKKYLDSSKKSKTPKENMDLRAGPLVDGDLASKAKKYKKLKTAMDSVAKPNKRKRVFKPSSSKKVKANQDNKKRKDKSDANKPAANKAAASRRIKDKGKKGKKSDNKTKKDKRDSE